ncbi:FtsK-like DNA translocase [Streptomyces phage Xkcd426]|nr:FtsK-like DNA translocase [Streptomyces phage Xkcd426]
MDEFDTPPIIETRPTGDEMLAEVAAGKRKPVTVQLRAAGQTLGRGLSLVVQPLEGPATRVRASMDERAEARTPEARAALMDANRGHRDAMRDLRRDRRAFEKAREEVSWWNVFNGERRAARAVVRDSAQLAREARSARKEAKAAYPLSLPALAARCHAAHLVPTGVWAAVSDGIASSAAFGTSVAATLLHAATFAVALRMNPKDTTDALLEALAPSQEERDLLQRLDPKEWHRVAEPRGLGDVVASGATLTDSGIQAKLTLNGTMDLATLQKKEAQLRAALRLREGTRMELREGKTGGHARLTLRTRSAADGVTLNGWQPGQPWGVNTVTGASFPVPLGRRMLIAGTSGSGKSWSARPILAEASEGDDQRLVILDMKRIEARLWKKRARIAINPDEILELLEELVAEMYRRLDLIPDGEDVVQISNTLPRITVFVDEGSELISAAKVKGYGEIMDHLRTLARMARAAEIVLVWATQKPLLSGDSPGLDSQVAGQITCRMSLAVATQKEAMVIFGDDAITEGWLAHKLPMPGVAMLRDSNAATPHHLKMRAVSPKDVMKLPARPIWSAPVGWSGTTKADIAARKAAEAPTDPWAGKTTGGDTVPLLEGPKVRVSAEDRDDQIMNELADDPCRTLSDLARAIGASKSVVKRRLDQMEADGLVCRDEDGCWHPVR